MRDFVEEARQFMAQERARVGGSDAIWDENYALEAIASAMEKAHALGCEVNRLNAQLCIIEENGTPWVPELLEWLGNHDCCPALPFTDYELIEALEARFGTKLYASTQPAGEGQAFVTVPRELTTSMLEAAEQEEACGNDFSDMWEAAIATYLFDKENGNA